MANVHGLRQLRENKRNQPNPSSGNINEHYDQIPFISSLSQSRQPIKQTIPYTLKLVLCPDLKVCSTSFIFLAIIWLIFIVCLMQGIEKINHKVLEVKYTVLQHFGSIDIFIKEGQIYRLILASFFHSDLVHITMNSISILFLCTRFQKIYRLETPFVLLASSITGFMLSAVCKSSTLTVGASSAIFGILGGFIAYLIINWTALQIYGGIRSTLTCIICVIVFVSFLFSTGKGIDTFSHIGGLMGGVLIGLAILPGIQYKNRMVTLIGTGACIGLNSLLCLILFFS